MGREVLGQRPHILHWSADIEYLVGLANLAVDHFVDRCRTGHLELKLFAAHGLD